MSLIRWLLQWYTVPRVLTNALWPINNLSYQCKCIGHIHTVWCVQWAHQRVTIKPLRPIINITSKTIIKNWQIDSVSVVVIAWPSQLEHLHWQPQKSKKESFACLTAGKCHNIVSSPKTSAAVYENVGSDAGWHVRVLPWLMSNYQLFLLII